MPRVKISHSINVIASMIAARYHGFLVDNYHLKLQPYKISIFEESKQAGFSWDTLQLIQLVFSRQLKAKKKRMPKYLLHEYN